MSTDTYLRGVLTVIAAMLVIIAWNTWQTADNVRKYSMDCGYYTPCKVRFGETVEVKFKEVPTVRVDGVTSVQVENRLPISVRAER